MTSFDELIGTEPEGVERAQLQRVHDLLVAAGPPPELTPQLESGPTLAMTLGRVRTMAKKRRRYIPLLAAAVLTLVILVAGLASTGSSFKPIPLTGTPNAPGASGVLGILPPTKTTQPMQVSVEGLDPGVYAVYLVHAGRSWEKCGTFTVVKTPVQHPTTINSPYRAKKGDTWYVTRVTGKGHGLTVLRPATT